MFTRNSLLTAMMFLAHSLPGMSHEFWIEPHEYQVETGEKVTADLKVGEEFKGGGLAYFDRSTARFETAMDGTLEKVAGRSGDIPALDQVADRDGLLVIIHETEPATLKYREWEKFAKFAAHKDFPDIRARHTARGLPESGFRESYTRFAKALVAVGSGGGTDNATGMETEFVARSNPYTDTLTEGFAADLIYQGQPRADAQVEVFEKATDGSVRVTYLRTDAAGRVAVPVKPGHDYLLDAVVLRPMDGPDMRVWETLWAALTFHVPE